MPTVLGNEPIPVADLLRGILKDPAVAASVLPFLERLDVPAGQKLIEQGSQSREMFFVEHGRAAVVLEAEDGPIRLATIGRGAIAGEMAFYLGRPRSASVVAETALVVWRLSGAGLDKLRREQPDTIIDFHLGMAAVLADRLASANRLVKLLAD
jgi:SulP family sulfate permease